MRFSIVIRRLGANLTALQMSQVPDIDINDIIDSCTVLNSLEISYCHTIQEDTLEGNLAHFQNLKKIKLKHISGPFDFRPLLHKYANLNEFHVADMSVMNESFIRQIVMAGRFTHLTKFVVDKCGDMSIDIACLLVHNCPNLTELGNIYTWSGVRFDEIETFSNFVRDNNLSLNFPSLSTRYI
jgi:hypothetical protein